MLCKRTYKNQITLPKNIIQKFKDTEYFEAEVENQQIILKPVKIIPLSNISLFKIKEKISSLGLSEKDLEEAILWARNK